MTAIVGLLVIVFFSLLINRIATVALTFTGLSREMAQFQARSAFTTVGFTTTESESVVGHPVRRRIIMLLMLVGNAGFVGVIATSLVSATSDSSYGLFGKLGALAMGLGALWIFGSSKWIDARLFTIISSALKQFTHLEVHDFQELLRMGEGFSVTEVKVEEEDWLVGQRLDELRLSDAGVNVLGINRSTGEYVGTPVGNTYIRRGDKILVYGARERIIALDEGRGDPEKGKEHQQFVEEKRAQWKKEADNRGEGYSVTEIVIRQKGWLAGKRLIDLRLGDVGINILGVYRAGGDYIGSPVGSTRLYGEDKVIVYGSQESVAALNANRDDPDGEEKHRQVIAQKQSEGETKLDGSDKASDD